MTLEENKRLAGDATRIWSTGAYETAPRIFAQDYVYHVRHSPDDARDLHGADAIVSLAKDFRRAFPDFEDTVDLQVAEGDLVVTHYTSTGTHEGPFLDFEPTHRRLSWTGTVIHRIEDGKIAESWGNWDMYGMLRQLADVEA
jgi:steroid delta-isomerase-like uncharacterized protein